MIKKELKKLNRRELVDVIYQMKQNEQELQDKITQLEEALQEKRIRISVAGSIAEAATDVTRIFATAQMTADLYLFEINCMKEETQRKCAGMIEDANKSVASILADGKKQYAELRARCQAEQEKLQQLMQEIEKHEQAVQAEWHEG